MHAPAVHILPNALELGSILEVGRANCLAHDVPLMPSCGHLNLLLHQNVHELLPDLHGYQQVHGQAGDQKRQKRQVNGGSRFKAHIQSTDGASQRREQVNGGSRFKAQSSQRMEQVIGGSRFKAHIQLSQHTSNFAHVSNQEGGNFVQAKDILAYKFMCGCNSFNS